MPIGRNRHGSAQTDPIRVVGPPGEDLERVRRDGHLQGVVFGSPYDVKPAPVGHLNHFQSMAGHLSHILTVVHALQINCQLKLHFKTFPELRVAPAIMSIIISLSGNKLARQRLV